jgi:hypothetical protein
LWKCFNLLRHTCLTCTHDQLDVQVFYTTKWIKASFVFRKVVFGKLFSRLFYICLPLEKLVNEKYFPVKEKFGLVSRKVFSFCFWWKILFGSCEKFKNVILFANYIKFGPKTFDCYIYLFWIFVFSISSLRI